MMKRRDFLKQLAGAGLVGSMPVMFRNVSAADNRFNGPILMTIHAGGGWDQSSFCDPRENASINHWAETAPAGTAGYLRFAPFAENAEFFMKYHENMLVVNGIDIQSNGHAAADRNRSTGSLMNGGSPSLNELYAGIHGQNMSMPLVRGGGFSDTVGILPFTDLPDENLLRALANPNRNATGGHFHKPADIEKVMAYRLRRLEAQRAQVNNMPRMQNNLDTLYMARTSSDQLGLLSDVMPDELDSQDLKGDDNRLVRQLHLFLVMALAGTTVTGSFSIGGFDTHNDHDQRHGTALPRLTRAVDYLWVKAEALGLADRIVLHITSDVGRTPRYNANNGKDHWSAGSDIFMAKNVDWTNRIVGATGPQHEKLSIDPQTLAVSDNGIRLIPKIVCSEVCKMLGIDQHPFALRYFANTPETAIFSSTVQTGIEV